MSLGFEAPVLSMSGSAYKIYSGPSVTLTSDSPFWNLSTSATGVGSGTATGTEIYMVLDSGVGVGTYTLGAAPLTVSGADQTAGFVNLDGVGESAYQLEFRVSGLENATTGQKAAFLDWLETSGADSVTSGETGAYQLLYRNPASAESAVFAWDFANLPAELQTLSLGLTAMNGYAVPEPASWMLLLLACVCVLGRKRAAGYTDSR